MTIPELPTQNPTPSPASYLKSRIARARSRLQTLWEAKGCTDAEVLAAGYELDELINEYQKNKFEG